jgi:hypothetical protein
MCFELVAFNLGYAYPQGYTKASYINQNETQETA